MYMYAEIYTSIFLLFNSASWCISLQIVNQLWQTDNCKYVALGKNKEIHVIMLTGLFCVLFCPPPPPPPPKAGAKHRDTCSVYVCRSIYKCVNNKFSNTAILAAEYIQWRVKSKHCRVGTLVLIHSWLSVSSKQTNMIHNKTFTICHLIRSSFHSMIHLFIYLSLTDRKCSKLLMKHFVGFKIPSVQSEANWKICLHKSQIHQNFKVGQILHVVVHCRLYRWTGLPVLPVFFFSTEYSV